MLSKAFLTSISHMCVLSPLVDCICDISSSVSICSVQLRPFLKPACSSDSLLLFSKCMEMFSLIILSMILIHVFMSDIGLWFAGLSRLSFPIGGRQIYALFIAVGISVVYQMC